MSRSPYQWLAVTLFWVAEGLLYAGAYYKPGVTLEEALRVSLVGALLWVPITFFALWASARWTLERGHLARRLGLHVVAAALIVVGRALVIPLANDWVGWYDVVPPLGRLLMQSLRANLLLYVLIVGAAHAVIYARRARERERQSARLAAQLTEAKLAALRSQLQPHFLFNALGAIAELMHRDVEAADRMIVRLSRLLRQSLDEGGAREVPLEHELGILEPYLELEKLRLGDRLSVTLEIDPAARAARVPALVLQPLVENAIRHGIAPRRAPGTVAIRARRDAGALLLEIEDDGAGLGGDRPGGIGLTNTRARLAELYGDASALELEGAPGRGTRVRLSIPQPPEAAA
jgi:LytS/YehU family sensor histidine kinase